MGRSFGSTGVTLAMVIYFNQISRHLRMHQRQFQISPSIAISHIVCEIRGIKIDSFIFIAPFEKKKKPKICLPFFLSC